MLLCAIKLFACHSLVPWFLMRETHLKAAFLALNMRVKVFNVLIELAVLAPFSKAMSKIRLRSETVY